MPSAIIIGASRGIGLGLTRELIGRGWTVVASHRGPAPDLAATGAELAQVDVDDDASVAALAARLAGRTFDHVLINAGIIGNRADTASSVTREAMAQLFWTNAIAPVRAARQLLPLVKDGGSIGFMTSILGSVAGRQSGWAELYSASKAALNSLSRGFAAQDVGSRPVAVLNLHPGWVKTDMGGVGADIDVATSVAGMRRVLAAANESHNGKFLNYGGEQLSW